MADYEVDGTYFSFGDAWAVEKIDDWPAYKKLTGKKSLGAKACDLVAVSESGEAWFIEVKDYTYPGVRPPADLADTVARKMFGTCALMLLVAKQAGGNTAQEFSQAVLAASSLTICLHVELKDGGRSFDSISGPLAELQEAMYQSCGPLGLSKKQQVVTNYHLLKQYPSKAPWSSHRDPGARLRHSDRR